MKQMVKIVAVAAAVVLAGVLLFSFWRGKQAEEQRRAEYEQMEKELRPLELELYRLRQDLSELRQDYNARLRGMGSVVFLFSNLDEAIYTEVYPQMKEYGYMGVLTLSETGFPGARGCMTREQFDELLDEGWTFCLRWDEQAEPEEWIASCRELVRGMGLSLPDTIYFPYGTYSGEQDAFLSGYGFRVVIHHGEEDLPILISGSGEGIWHPGAMGWNQSGAASVLESAITEGCNIVYTVGSDYIAEEYKESTFGSMLARIDGYCKEEKLAVVDLENAREYRNQLEQGKDDMERDYTGSREEVEARVEALEQEIKAVIDKYEFLYE